LHLGSLGHAVDPAYDRPGAAHARSAHKARVHTLEGRELLRKRDAYLTHALIYEARQGDQNSIAAPEGGLCHAAIGLEEEPIDLLIA
jgi:hypothetical protein